MLPSFPCALCGFCQNQSLKKKRLKKTKQKDVRMGEFITEIMMCNA